MYCMMHIQNPACYRKFRHIQPYLCPIKTWSGMLWHIRTLPYLEPKIHSDTAQKVKFSIKDFSSKYDQSRSFIRIWSHLLKKSLMENFIFCAVRTLSRHILVFSERCVTFAWWEPCHIQNLAIFRILAYWGPVYIQTYSESCLNRHIQAYSGIFDNDSYNNINLFFTLILHTFQRNLKWHISFGYNDVISNFNARLSLLKWYAIFQNSVIIE